MASAQTHTGPGASAPEPRAGRGRRTTVVAAVVAGCALAVAAPFALHGGGASLAPTSPVAPVTSTGPQVPDGALRGDVDGDGLPDVVRLSRGGLLRIDLGTGTTVRRLLSDDPVLEGLARIDDSGLVVVTSTRVGDGTAGRDWAVRRVLGGQVRPVRLAPHETLGSRPGVQTAWINADLALHDGGLDPLQRGADHVAVLTRTWTLHDGRLTGERVGVWCWDRSGSEPPAGCAAGQDWRYDVGPQADLPALLPAARAWPAGPDGVTTDDGYTWTLHRGVPPGPVESPHYDLVVTGQGTTQTVTVPSGWGPTMSGTPVRIGDLSQGVLLEQEGGDSDTWRVYVRWGGQVQELRTRGPVALGGGFVATGDAAYLSWVSADGRLFTRVGTARPGRFHVYAWVPTAATASTPPVLATQDLGLVCLDETWRTYGTCAG